LTLALEDLSHYKSDKHFHVSISPFTILFIITIQLLSIYPNV
jgi:hypothetical protein